VSEVVRAIGWSELSQVDCGRDFERIEASRGGLADKRLECKIARNIDVVDGPCWPSLGPPFSVTIGWTNAKGEDQAIILLSDEALQPSLAYRRRL
jgi:hypothetical protein